MDENLHYLLHEELEGLFDLPAAKAAQSASQQAVSAAHAAASEALERAHAPGSVLATELVSATERAPSPAADGDQLIERFLRPDVLEALTKLAGVSPEQVLAALAKLVGVQPQQVLSALVKQLGAR